MTDLAMVSAGTAATRVDTPTARTAAGLAIGFVGLTLSAVFMVYLHVAAGGQLDPLDATMSAYVFADGVGWMFGASAVCLAIGGFGALLGLSGTELLSGSGGQDQALLRLGLWLVPTGALLVALFPTNRAGPLSLSAEIHRYSAGVVFISLPIAAYLAVRRLASPELARYRAWLCRSALAAAVAAVVFLVCHFGSLPEPVQQVRGLAQRVLFLLELVLLGQLIYLPVRLLGHGPSPVRYG